MVSAMACVPNIPDEETEESTSSGWEWVPLKSTCFSAESMAQLDTNVILF